MFNTLEPLLEACRKDGWAAARGSMLHAQIEARRMGWTEVKIRKGDPVVTTLRPLDQTEARANSLSAKYGKGVQPLHTDGAHLFDPPDILVLYSEEVSPTPTLLWKERIGIIGQPIVPVHVKHGIFLVSNGRDSFFSTACSERGFRYDPGCMVPSDARARQSAAYFEAAAEQVVEHHWDEPGKLLVIDNRRALHARASAVNDTGRAIQRVSFHLKRGTS